MLVLSVSVCAMLLVAMVKANCRAEQHGMASLFLFFIFKLLSHEYLVHCASSLSKFLFECVHRFF